MTSVLRASMYQDFIEEVGSVREWLDPYDTQMYLRDHWGFSLTGATASFLPRSVYRSDRKYGGFEIDNPRSSYETLHDSSQGSSVFFGEESTQIHPAELLAESLIWKSVCFGEGPRFFKGNIDATAAEFLARIINSQQGVEATI